MAYAVTCYYVGYSSYSHYTQDNSVDSVPLVRSKVSLSRTEKRQHNLSSKK